MCPAEADPGRTVKLPLRFSTVHSGTPVDVVDCTLPVVGLVDPVARDEDEADVVGWAGSVVLDALRGELLLQAANAALATDR
jgi:hypothetical protein